MKKKMYRCLACTLLLLAGTVTAVSAADNKVVVIPLNTSVAGNNNTVIDGYGISGILLGDEDNIYMSSIDSVVLLHADGTCAVTITGFVNNVDSSNAIVGPALAGARQAGSDAPVTADWATSPLLKVTGASTSTSGSVTSWWFMDANISYRFGCGFIGNPASWQDDIGTCRITWVCGVD